MLGLGPVNAWDWELGLEARFGMAGRVYDGLHRSAGAIVASCATGLAVRIGKRGGGVGVRGEGASTVGSP